MAGTVYTPPPLPAPATPTATGGTFSAALHHLLINSGTLTGSAGYPTSSPVNVNFADSPIDGTGTGTGTVTVTVVPGASSATHRVFDDRIVIWKTGILPQDWIIERLPWIRLPRERQAPAWRVTE